MLDSQGNISHTCEPNYDADPTLVQTDKLFYLILDETGDLKVIDLYDYSYSKIIHSLTVYQDKRTFMSAGQYLDHTTEMLSSPDGFFFTQIDDSTDALQVKESKNHDNVILEIIQIQHQGCRVTLTEKGDYRIVTYNNLVIWSLVDYLARKKKKCPNNNSTNNCDFKDETKKRKVQVKTEFERDNFLL